MFRECSENECAKSRFVVYGHGKVEPQAHSSARRCLATEAAARGPIGDPATLAYLDRLELDYMSHIVIQVFEDMSRAEHDPARYRVCMLLSPGVQPMEEDVLRASALPETFGIQQPVVISESYNLSELERHLEECVSAHACGKPCDTHNLRDTPAAGRGAEQ